MVSYFIFLPCLVVTSVAYFVFDKTKNTVERPTQAIFEAFHPEILSSYLKDLDLKRKTVKKNSEKYLKYLLQKGKVLLFQHDLELAKEQFEKITKQSVVDEGKQKPCALQMEAHYFLGVLHHRNVDYLSSIECFSRAIDVFDANAIKLDFGAKLYKRILESREKRHKAMKSVSDLSPLLLDPFSLNNKRLQRDATEKKLYDFLHSDVLCCTLDELYNARGLSCLADYQFSLASQDFTTAMQLCQQHHKMAILHFNCGLALYYNRQFEESEPWFTKAIALSQDTEGQPAHLHGVEAFSFRNGLVQSLLYRAAVRERCQQFDLALQDQLLADSMRMEQGKEGEVLTGFHYRLLSLDVLLIIMAFLEDDELQYQLGMGSQFFRKKSNYVVTHSRLWSRRHR